MVMSRAKSGFLWLLKNTLNRLTIRLARAGRGPFSLIRHVGRTSGRVYETPLILARDGDYFVAELTYGPQVNWYRNVVAAGGCTVVTGRAEWAIDGIDDLDADAGRRAFGFPQSLVLRVLCRRDFRRLHIADLDAS